VIWREMASMATGAHGGMGFPDPLVLHYWCKRIGLRQMLGETQHCREEAARVQGWGV